MKLCWRVLIVALLAVACQRTTRPELLVVSSLSPGELQLGGVLKIVGEGFALGKPASVTLRGDVYRPGVAPQPIVLRVPATAQSQTELALTLSRQLQPSLCGEPESATHATFRGDVEVAIAARRPGTPPVIGTLRGAVLELYPAQKSESAEASSLGSGRRMLEFLGLELTALPSGLSVARVAPGSRAERAGVAPGDRLVSAAGVSVLEPSDLLSEPSRALALVVARAGAELELELDSDGFAPVPPASVAWAGVLVGAVALGFVLLASPWAGGVRRLEQGLSDLVARMRERRLDGALMRSRLRFAPRPELWLVFVPVVALPLAPLAGLSRFDPLHGLLALWLLARLGLSSLALVHGGRRGAWQWSLRQGTRSALCELAIVLPPLVALGAALSEPGLDFARVLARQGALPWQWRAFENPALLLSLALVLLSALPLGLGRARLRAGASRGCRRTYSSVDSLPGWLHLCAVAALASVIFLGGDRLPAGASELFGGGAFTRVLAACVLLLKIAGVVALVCLIRTALTPPTGEQWARISLVTGLPLALALAGLEQLWQRAGALGDALRWLDRGFAPAAFAAALLVAGALALRTLLGWGRRHPPSPVSPWL
jgi:NADH:ubiquinone oxidoreductase subunit H